MLKNYTELPNGLVRQKQIKFNKSANTDYVNRYKSLGNLVDQMSMLRIGYILGMIGLPKSILDVGYGTGNFLHHASQIIPNCYGYDTIDTPLDGNIKKVNSILNQYYDVVTFFDSLEHMNNISFVKDLKCSYVVITVPECHRPWDADWFLNWKHRRPDEHLWHFTRRALLLFFAENGYTCVGLSNVEDTIRGQIDGESNILTGIFQKIRVDFS